MINNRYQRGYGRKKHLCNIYFTTFIELQHHLHMYNISKAVFMTYLSGFAFAAGLNPLLACIPARSSLRLYSQVTCLPPAARRPLSAAVLGEGGGETEYRVYTQTHTHGHTRTRHGPRPPITHYWLGRAGPSWTGLGSSEVGAALGRAGLDSIGMGNALGRAGSGCTGLDSTEVGAVLGIRVGQGWTGLD